MTRRRSIIRAGGTALSTLGGMSSLVAGQRPDPWRGTRTSLPSENVSSKSVTFEAGNQNPAVDTGDWINYNFGLLFKGSKKDAKRKLTEGEFIIKLEGEPVENPRQYLSGLSKATEYNDYDYVVRFDAYIPPKPPRRYKLTIKFINFRGEVINVDGDFQIAPSGGQSSSKDTGTNAGENTASFLPLVP